MIEGIGCLHGLLEPPSCFEYGSVLNEFIQENQVLISNPAAGFLHFSNSNCPTILSINNATDKYDLILSPNPSKDNFTISFPELVHEPTIMIFNNLGEKVLRKMF